jgi:hypothetical protein
MPREAWRNHPEYLDLWRGMRQNPGEPGPALVLSDWLEEHGHLDAMWVERLRGLSGQAPKLERGIARAGYIPIGEGAWRLLLAAPPPDQFLVLFDCNVQAYQYIRQFTGRCGWNFGLRDWPSQTERDHLLAIPRLEMLAAQQMTRESWNWTTGHLPGLTHLEVEGPQIQAEDLARLRRLPALRHLVLEGRAAENTTAISPLLGLRHLTLGPYTYLASRIQAKVPNLESLAADVEVLGEMIRWPNLRSFEMSEFRGRPRLCEAEVIALSRYPHIERINIRCEELTSAAIHALAAAPHLRELRLRHEEGPLPPLDALADCPVLESLTIEAALDESRVVPLGHIPGLRQLTLTNATFGEAGVAALSHLSSLERLQITGDFTGDQPPLALAHLPYLELLDLRFFTMPESFAPILKDAAPPWVDYPLVGA